MEILSGIISGIVAEASRGLTRLFRKRPPNGGRGPRIEGTWEYANGTMQIRQFGTRVRATATRTSSTPHRHFKYTGEFLAGQLVLTWEDRQAEGYMMGAMVLRLTAQGELKGKTTYVAVDSANVVSDDRTYWRGGSRQTVPAA